MSDSAAVRGLQAALAAEHAVIWAYDVIGPLLPASDQQPARSAQAAHVTRRDVLTADLQARKATPVAARADYQLPFPVDSASGAMKLAVLVEQRCATAWRYLLESVTEESLRRQAVDALVATAVQATRWSKLQGSPRSLALPGSD